MKKNWKHEELWKSIEYTLMLFKQGDMNRAKTMDAIRGYIMTDPIEDEPEVLSVEDVCNRCLYEHKQYPRGVCFCDCHKERGKEIKMMDITDSWDEPPTVNFALVISKLNEVIRSVNRLKNE